MSDTFYIFLDEGGNLDFSTKGSKYFTMTSAVMKWPFDLFKKLDDYKYDVIEYGLDLEYFHCCEDNNHIRSRLFETLYSLNTDEIRVDSIIVEKIKTGWALREFDKFYPYVLGALLQYVTNGINKSSLKEIIIITDQLPLQRKRKAVEKAIKLTLAKVLPKTIKYRIYHHSSKAHYGLQIADYCNWAVLRKWDKKDDKYYTKVNKFIRSEFNIFEKGNIHFYQKK